MAYLMLLRVSRSFNVNKFHAPRMFKNHPDIALILDLNQGAQFHVPYTLLGLCWRSTVTQIAAQSVHPCVGV